MTHRTIFHCDATYRTLHYITVPHHTQRHEDVKSIIILVSNRQILVPHLFSPTHSRAKLHTGTTFLSIGEGVTVAMMTVDYDYICGAEV